MCESIAYPISILPNSPIIMSRAIQIFSRKGGHYLRNTCEIVKRNGWNGIIDLTKIDKITKPVWENDFEWHDTSVLGVTITKSLPDAHSFSSFSCFKFFIHFITLYTTLNESTFFNIPKISYFNLSRPVALDWTRSRSRELGQSTPISEPHLRWDYLVASLLIYITW